MVESSIPHYRILEEIGRGGMGVVYRAEDLRLGRHVALKRLPPELQRDAERLALFRREARTLATLNHPCIVTIFAVEEADDQLVLAMELVEGRTLREVIPPGGLKLPRFFRIAVPLADALSAAHDRGVVHRDLKPGNIMITDDGHVKILDFGLAKLTRSTPRPGDSLLSTELMSSAGAIPGTVPYMSPEEIRGTPADHRSDIFSLGIVLFEMAVGKHPFVGGSPAEVVSSILRDSPDSLSDLRGALPTHLTRIVRGCLEKDPERRFQSAKDVRNQLEDLEKEETHPEHAVPRPSGWRRPGRRYVAVALAAVVLLVLVAVLWRLQGVTPGGDSAPAIHLALAEHQLLPGPSRPEPYRTGLIEILRERLAALDGAFLVAGSEGPEPDLQIQADAKRTGERVLLSFRLSSGPQSLGEELLEGTADQPFRLVDEVAARLARILRSRGGAAAGYRAPPVPTGDADAARSYLLGLAALATANGADDLRTAIGHFDEALNRDPGLARARARRGRALYRIFQETADGTLLTRAEADCASAARAEPGFAPAQTCRGDVLRALEQPTEAVAAYRQAIEANGAETAAYTGLRLAYYELGRPAAAEETWKRIIALYPRFWAGHFQLGGYYYDTENLIGAIEQYERALELTPRNFTVYYAMGAAQLLVGRYGEAVSSLERSIRVRPDHRAYSTLGYAYLLLRRHDEAVEALERAVEFPGADYLAWGQLANAYHWAPGRRGEAAPAFERAAELAARRLERTPGDAGVMMNLAYYQAMLGNGDTSRETLRSALERRPDDAHFAYRAGIVYNAAGDSEAAIDWLRQAVAGGYPLHEIRVTPELDNLRDEPRFRELLGSG